MNRYRKAGASAAAAVILIVLVGVVPLVPYSISFTPGSPTVTGYAPLLYRLTGVGGGPFAPLVLLPEGAGVALVHLEGTRIAYWEGPFPAGTTVNPSGVVTISRVGMTEWISGLLNFSVTVTNLGSRAISNLSVILHYPTYGRNESEGGLTRSFAPDASCAAILLPSETCTAVASLPQSAALLNGEVYALLAEAWSPGNASDPSGFESPFVYARSFSLTYQGAALSPGWVNQFIQTVNDKRNATALVENRTLDEFAAFRYDSLRSGYQISDYNFEADYGRFFGNSSYGIFEEVLYPQGQSPSGFPDVLHKLALEHWTGLMNPAYTKFGYFFATGPTIITEPGCPVTEIPGPNINITRYVMAAGCSYVIADQVWLILILGT